VPQPQNQLPFRLKHLAPRRVVVSQRLPFMRTPCFTLAVVLSGSALCSAESPKPFGGERIGIPPLSLQESLQQSFGSKPLQFNSADPGPTLLGPTGPNLAAFKVAAAARKPRISAGQGMPIIEPNPDVAYSLKVHAPDPAVDFKMLVKDPSAAEK
jgi:hypothetical protein